MAPEESYVPGTEHPVEVAEAPPAESIDDIARQRGHRLTGLLIANLVVGSLGVLTGLVQWVLVAGIREGRDFSNHLLTVSDWTSIGIDLIQGVLFLVTAIFWLRWLHASYKALERRQGEALRFTPGWAVGYWFIPLVNLLRPYQVMEELRAQSQSITDEPFAKAQASTIGFWWVLWVASHFVNRTDTRLALRAETFEQITFSTVFSIGADALMLGLTAIALMVIRHLVALQLQWQPFEEDIALEVDND
ncbi:MAG: DUF4328 domain-containing protein [Acidobacteriota bacterium]